MKNNKNILNKYSLTFSDENLENEYRSKSIEKAKIVIRIAILTFFSVFLVYNFILLLHAESYDKWSVLFLPPVVGALFFTLTFLKVFEKIYVYLVVFLFISVSVLAIYGYVLEEGDFVFLYLRIIFFSLITFFIFRFLLFSFLIILLNMFFVPFFLSDQGVNEILLNIVRVVPFMGISGFTFYVWQRADRFNFLSEKVLVEKNEKIENSRKKLENEGAVGRILEGAGNGDTSLDEFLNNALDVILELPWLKSQSKGVVSITNNDGDLEVKAVRNLKIIEENCTLVKSGECLCGNTLRDKKMIFDSAVPVGSDLCIDDMSTHGNYSMPLIFKEKVLGVLNVYVERNHVQQKEEVVFLELVSKTIATVIHRFHLENEKEAQRQELLDRHHVLESARKKLENDSAIGRILESSTSTDLVLKAFLQNALEVILDLSWLNIKSKGSIFVTNSDGNLDMVVEKDLGILTSMCALIKPGQCLCGKALERKEMVFENCVTANHDIEPEGMKPHGHFNIPLMLNGEVLGVLNVYVDHGHVKTEEEVQFFNLVGNTLATVIYRFQIEKERNEQTVELNRYFTAIEQSAASILFTDVKGIVNYANPHFYKLTGYNEGDILGRGTSLLSSGKTPRSTYDSLWKSIQNKETWEGEFINVKKDGTEYIERAIISPVINPDGSIAEYIAVKDDITAYKKATQEIIAQRDEIEESHNKIKASIDYAKRIQDSLLSSSFLLNTVFEDVTVSFLPKETVSGDFYIVKKQKDKVMLAVADCTGHGVPGALVATLGILELSHLMDVNASMQVSQILDLLSANINSMLNNDNEIGSDGMDLSLLSIDTKEQTIEYAGAKGILYLHQNNELIKLKTDRVSIGEKRRDLDFAFSLNKIAYNTGDTLFLLTDGLIDQLSAVNKRRVGSKRVKELFNKMVQENYSQQKDTLNDFITTHTSSVHQTDDITLIKFKL